MRGLAGLARRPMLTITLALASKAAAATPLIDQLTRRAEPTAGKVRLTIPEVVEDGGAVPLAVMVESPMTAADHVRSIHLVAALNPEPTVAVFQLSPACGRAAVATRIRLAESQIVVAMAEMSDGGWYVGRAPAKVAIGGCGSGAIGPAAATGDPRVKLPATVHPGEVFEIKTLIAHPMHTGRQTDLAGATIPRQIVGRFSCRARDTELFGADLGTGIAANPYVAFHARLDHSAELEFLWVEEGGRRFTARQTILVVG